MALAAGGDVMQLQVSKRLAIHVAPLSLTPLHTLRIFVLRSVGLAAPHAPRRVAPLSPRSHHLPLLPPACGSISGGHGDGSSMSGRNVVLVLVCLLRRELCRDHGCVIRRLFG